MMNSVMGFDGLHQLMPEASGCIGNVVSLGNKFIEEGVIGNVVSLGNKFTEEGVLVTW